MQVDFQSLMSGFSAPVDTGDPIKSIYGIIPYMDSTQMHLKFQLMYFIEKYDLSEWRKVFEDIDKQLQNNKNINFFSSQNLKALLSAYTQTFLRVRDSVVFGRVVTQNNIFKLVHPCVGKHQGRVIFYHHRSRGNNVVSFRLKEILE